MTRDAEQVISFLSTNIGEISADRMRELNVLNCLLQGGRLSDAQQYISPDDFLQEDTRRLAEIFWQASEFEDRNALFTDFGLTEQGNQILLEVPSSFGIAENTAQYARTLARERLRQRLTKRLGNAMQDLRGGDPEAVAASLGMPDALAAPSETLAAAIDASIAEGERASASAAEGRPAGFSTGLPALDRRTGGVLIGDLWTLVADTSMGKSALAIQLSRSILKHGCKVGYLSLEMPSQDLARRCLAQEGGINSTELRKGNRSELNRAKTLVPALSKLPLLIDTDSDTPDAISSRLYSWAAEGVQVVVLDHLMNVHFDKRDPFGDQGRMMKSLRRLTMSLKLSILCVTQYRKDSGNSRTMADIYGSAAVSQYSTHVLAIHGDSAGDDLRRLELFKNRDGVKGGLSVKFRFDGPTQVLHELNPGGTDFPQQDEEFF